MSNFCGRVHTSDRPSHAPRSLIVRFANVVSYDAAKQSLENLGLIVREKGLSWEKRHVLHVTTPDENLAQWITILYSDPMIHLVEKERLSYPSTT